MKALFQTRSRTATRGSRNFGRRYGEKMLSLLGHKTDSGQ